MKKLIGSPINDTQTRFNALCELGGGANGGPARGPVLALLKQSGQHLNQVAYREVAEITSDNAKANPWHVCFAIGLCWGHLAQFDSDFVRAAASFIAEPNDSDLKAAKSYRMERGPEPIEQSLRGAHMLFDKVSFPEALPGDLQKIYKLQQRWFGPLSGKEKPPYIGDWNATAMFMVALFAQPALAATQQSIGPLLPPGGPIDRALAILKQAGIVKHPPSGSELDDGTFESGRILESNALFEEIRKGMPDWSLIDVHSGLYMLGSKHQMSGRWA